MGLFGKDDAVTAWRKEMQAAIKDGDIEHFKFLLKRDIDAPPSVLDTVLSQAINENKLKITRILLDEEGQRTLDSGVLRKVVYEGRSEMYRMLTDAGWDFARAAPGGDGTAHYQRLERMMARELENQRLREELAAVKKELTELKKTYGIEEANTPAGTAGEGPKKFTP